MEEKRQVQQKIAPLVEDAIADMLRQEADAPPSIGIADLGCSSGPNALFLVATAVDAVRRRCRRLRVAAAPELCIFLNDLPGNDFNTVFGELPAFLRRQKESMGAYGLGPVFVFGAPGSFFGRLFPTGSLHLVCSSFSLHWLSQVPEELANGETVNKGNICAGRTSPPAVIAAYARQFKKDFTRFLLLRAEEVAAGGRVVITLKGRSARDPRSRDCIIHDHPSNVLNDMASRGLIDEEKLDSYNIAAYDPCLEEVREIVEAEGSFEAMYTDTYETDRKDGMPASARTTPAAYARMMRAVHEPALARHFGAGINMDEFARAVERYFDQLLKEGRYGGVLVHVVSLRRREC